MTIENIIESLAKCSFCLDSSVPPTVERTKDGDVCSLIFHVALTKRSNTEDEEFFKENEVFHLKYNPKLFDMLKNTKCKKYIAIHHGKDDMNIYSVNIARDILLNGLMFIYISEHALHNAIRPSPEEKTDAANPNGAENDASPKSDTAPKGIECNNWNDVLSTIEGFNKRFDELEKRMNRLFSAHIGDTEPPLADEDCEDDDEDVEYDADCVPCDAAESTENKTAADDSKGSEKVTYSIEGSMRPDGTINIVEVDENGKRTERTLKKDEGGYVNLLDVILKHLPNDVRGPKLSDLID